MPPLFVPSASFAIFIAGPAWPITWFMISLIPWAPLSTVRLSTPLNAVAAAATISGSLSASCWPITASDSRSSASARLPIASASARPVARIEAPWASPLAWIADASAAPTSRVCFAVAVAASSIRRASASALSSTSRLLASASSTRASRWPTASTRSR